MNIEDFKIVEMPRGIMAGNNSAVTVSVSEATKDRVSFSICKKEAKKFGLVAGDELVPAVNMATRQILLAKKSGGSYHASARKLQDRTGRLVARYPRINELAELFTCVFMSTGVELSTESKEHIVVTIPVIKGDAPAKKKVDWEAEKKERAVKKTDPVVEKKDSALKKTGLVVEDIGSVYTTLSRKSAPRMVGVARTPYKQGESLVGWCYGKTQAIRALLDYEEEEAEEKQKKG